LRVTKQAGNLREIQLHESRPVTAMLRMQAEQKCVKFYRFTTPAALEEKNTEERQRDL
jgi:hypothetical protein